jgi:hypothetical protein
MSHYVKSAPGPNGKVACPTLLNQACLNCGQPGHTIGYCVEPKKSHQHPSKSNQHPPKSNLRNPPKSNPPMQAADFPSLTQEPIHGHVYNPKSNAFGALSQKQPKQPKQPKQSPQQLDQQLEAEAKPMTMAERLKNPPAPVAVAKPVAFKIKFADMPPKSQFWWQDEVE